MESLERIRKVVLNHAAKRKKRYHVSSRSAFQVLIGAVLSQRTRDENTDRAARNLFSAASTPEKIAGMRTNRLRALIKPSGFYRTKAKNIKRMCEILVRDYGGNVPKDREALMKLPGVGFKTADIVLLYGFGVPTIPVDVHVEVVSKRLGLVGKGAKYEEVRQSLEGLFRKNDLPEINAGMVEFGQRICLTARPKCYICPLADVCKYGKKNLVPPKGYQA